MNLFENLCSYKESNSNESYMGFDEWLSRNYTDLVDDYIDEYGLNDEDRAEISYYDDDELQDYIARKYQRYVRNTNHYNEDFEINDTNQKYTSANTSINSSKLPAIFKLVKFEPNTINLDYGGGKFDNATEWLKEQNVTNLIYDPYNRSSEHNKQVIDKIKENGGADSVTCSNVLNVIAEPEARQTVLNNIHNLVKSGAPVYITIYEGNKSGTGGATKSGYQLNKNTNDYLEEIKSIFSNVTRKGKLIIAYK